MIAVFFAHPSPQDLQPRILPLHPEVALKTSEQFVSLSLGFDY